jgi:CubicO group peptidase (beta-lactamase class C family)
LGLTKVIQENVGRLTMYLCLIWPITATLAISSVAAGAEEMVFPDKEWEQATPESQEVDSSILNQAIDYLHANSGGVGAAEAVIVRNGYIIWKGSDAESYHFICSGTKTFTTTVLGLLIQDGIISSVDDRAVDYLPSLDDAYPQYADITFRHLASMTSGYDSIKGDSWRLYRQERYDEHYQCVLTYTTPGQPLFHPGKSFKYHDPAIHMLGYILTRVSGRTLRDIFGERIADPIGITRWNWPDYGTREGLNGVVLNNPAGTPYAKVQGGIVITPMHLARYGHLYLNKGNWNGQQLIDASWIDEATTSQVPNNIDYIGGLDRRGQFGFMWWTNGTGPDGKRPWPSAPPGSYTLHGAGRNFCFVIPEWDMVLVRMSPMSKSPMSNDDHVWNEFFKRLSTAL